MALTQDQKSLIMAVAEGNMADARRDAYLCVIEDRSQKNEDFCRKYKDILQHPEKKAPAVPPGLSGIVEIEAPDAFRPERYFLSEREEPLAREIMAMQKACGKLSALGVRCANATLLHGESGTGKTMFARYLAHEAGLPLVYLNFGWLIDSLMGKTGRNLSAAFKFASETPCVFFLDEIDCISLRREGGDSGGTAGELGRITITLMQEFDRLGGDAIVLGATNRPDRVDPALKRRFMRTHEVKALNRDEMRVLAGKYLADAGTALPEDGLQKIIADSRSQADMINRIVQALAETFAEEARAEESGAPE